MTILGVACVSAAALMFEVALARLFSIAHGQELSYMIISLALLGYGIATPLLCRCSPIIRWPTSLWACGLSASISVVLFLTHLISLDTARLAWEWAPWFKTGILYFLLSIPFLFAGLTIASLFMRYTQRSHAIYAGDLLGAGGGAILPFFFLPLDASFYATIFAALGALFLSRGKKEWIYVVVFLTLSITLSVTKPSWNPPMSPSRGLPQALLQEGAQHKGTVWSPWTRLDFFSGTAARVAPGLSLNYLGDAPSTDGISIDGHFIFPDIKDYRDKDYLGYIPQALPYVVSEKPSILLVHTKGGIALGEALYHKARSVDLVEDDSLFKNIFRDVPDLNWHIMSLRSFLRRSTSTFDLIQVGGIGATGALSSGFGGMNLNSDLTQEIFERLFRQLSKDGVLVYHLYHLPPLRLELRLFETIRRGLRAMGIEKPQEHLTIVQSLQTMSFLVHRDRPQFQAFVQSRGYEVIYPSRHSSLSSKLLHQSAEGGLKEYPFVTTGITDSRPFPNQSLRLTKIKDGVRLAKGHWEWIWEGGGMGWAVLLQALFGALLILLIAWHRRLREESRRHLAFDLFFVAIGFGFIFLEIGWIQQSMLVLTHPARSIPLVLGSVLIGAGIGARLGGLFPMSRFHLMAFSCGMNGLIALVVAFIYPSLLEWFAGLMYPELGVVLCLLSLSIFLGIPFPTALSHFQTESVRIPWVWGLNACVSVVGAVAAALLIPFIGFKWIFISAALFYLLAVVVSLRLSLGLALGLSRSSEQI